MKGYIYKITNADDSIVYIGSTTLTLIKRWKLHISSYQRWLNGSNKCQAMIYHHFREHGIDAFAIHLVSEHDIDERKNLLQFEQLVIDSTNCVNMVPAHKTDEEKRVQKQTYRDSHKDEATLRAKQHYEANKDRIKARANERIECECGNTYTRYNKSRHIRSNKHLMLLADQSYFCFCLIKHYREPMRS
jgi:hypothetical protein